MNHPAPPPPPPLPPPLSVRSPPPLSHSLPSLPSSTSRLPRVNISAQLEAVQKEKTRLDEYEGPRLWTEIPQNEVLVGGAIANGTFGYIHQGEYKGQKVALKMMNAKYIGSYDYNIFYTELQILTSCTHENILQILGANTQERTTYFMVLEYLEAGDLFHFLETHGHELNWEQIMRIAISIARGMEYLHIQGIMLRDLKSANILLKSSLVPVICDFGMALRNEAASQVKHEATGTPLWMAPEVYMKEKYTQKSDVYSFGIILTELVSGLPPFHEREDEDWEIIVKEVVTKSARPFIPDFCPDILRNLITQCTHAVPTSRPSFGEILVSLETVHTNLDNFPPRNVTKRIVHNCSNIELQHTEESSAKNLQVAKARDADLQARKEMKKQGEKLNLLQHLLKLQNENSEWTWQKTPFALIGTDDQVVRAKLRNFLRSREMFVSEDGPRCDVWTTCIIYCFVKSVIQSLNKHSPEKHGETATDEIEIEGQQQLVTNLLQNTDKINWQQNTETTLTTGYVRFFVGLDARKKIFTKWQEQLQPLAEEFVNQYTIVKQLI